MDYQTISDRVEATGMAVRGGVHPSDADNVPVAGLTAIVVGNTGGSFWDRFRAREHHMADPLDDWTRRQLNAAAADLKATIVFPFGGPPYHPIMQWAQNAEAVYPSLYGPLIHPKLGLWHAYRGLLVFAERLDLPARTPHANPCTTCDGNPCLSACPVGAVTQSAFARDTCAEYLAGDEGRDCMQNGCAARRACPIGAGHRYPSDQIQFHMQAFLRNAESC